MQTDKPTTTASNDAKAMSDKSAQPENLRKPMRIITTLSRIRKRGTMSEYEDYLIREATGQTRDFELQEPVEPNDSNETGDTFAETNKIAFFQEHGELPIEYLREYDGAAEYFAKQGKLPDAMGSPGALDYIQGDPEAFEQRVRDFQYAAAMEKTDISNLNSQQPTTAQP